MKAEKGGTLAEMFHVQWHSTVTYLRGKYSVTMTS
jgi:hypothetical protein